MTKLREKGRVDLDCGCITVYGRTVEWCPEHAQSELDDMYPSGWNGEGKPRRPEGYDR